MTDLEHILLSIFITGLFVVVFYMRKTILHLREQLNIVKKNKKSGHICDRDNIIVKLLSTNDNLYKDLIKEQRNKVVNDPSKKIKRKYV